MENKWIRKEELGNNAAQKRDTSLLRSKSGGRECGTNIRKRILFVSENSLTNKIR
jgi:hypothetical protein